MSAEVLSSPRSNMDQQPEIAMTEQVVMTPKSKTANSTILIIERRILKTTNEKMHVAGGEHTGIIINKEVANENGEFNPAQLSLEFRVFLVSAQTGNHTQESRTLRFWFRPPEEQLMEENSAEPNNKDHNNQQASIAQDFFRELVSPQEFPRDYVGFIKKIMKLMQHSYRTISKLEVELTQLKESTTMPSRPLSADENSLGNVILLSKEKVLEIIESSYPNPVTIQDIAKDHDWDEEEVAHHLSELQSRSLVKAMDHGAFTRQQSQDTQVIIVKQMPTIVHAKQPTIAIITAQYCEKLAVDAMIENKETFVRYTTVEFQYVVAKKAEMKKKQLLLYVDVSPNLFRHFQDIESTIGESNVYTLGNIGAHRIVCTKLPSVGHTREAMTAAGNTTTRLLGTFQRVDYVFLVGVGGGMPHYTDYNKHVRLGDVVVSCPTTQHNGYVYVYCENAKISDKGYDFEIKSYSPRNFNLQEIAARLKRSSSLANNDQNNELNSSPWLGYLKEGMDILNAQTIETDFKPPSADTDKLYMNIGDRDLIEVAHPAPQDKNVKRQEGRPRIHLSPIASGRQIVKNDQLRQQFATQVEALAYDYEFDAVIESVLGNCKDSFIIIRGISDYKDGTRRKEWQPYASLTAASVMKSIICGLELPTNA